MPTGTELNDQIEQAYHAVMRDGTVGAIAREAIKDVRSTMMEFFFGKGERGSEPGTPLTPLYYDLVAARKEHDTTVSHEVSPMDSLPTPSQVIDNPAGYLPQTQSQANTLEVSGPDRGLDTGTIPTPSQVIDNPAAYQPEPMQQPTQQQELGREM